MVPEVRVLLDRANRHRYAILELLDTAPEQFWRRAVPGDAWSARAHVAHLVTMDEPVAALARAAASGARVAWIFGTAEAGVMEAARMAAMAEFSGADPGDLRSALVSARTGLREALDALSGNSLEMDVLVAGAVDAWGRQHTWPLRDYLRHWAEHDRIHEAAIRAAFTAPPDLSAVALTRRLR
jgi:hypothetical protein